MEVIFNEVLRAFDFYNNWERKLLEAAKSATPEQDIIDACIGFFGPLFIMDLNMNLIAFSKEFEYGKINTVWDEYLTYQNPSLHTISEFKSSTYAQLLQQDNDLLVYEEPKAAPYSHGIMISVYTHNKELVAQMAVCSDTAMTQRDLQLSRSVKHALEQIENISLQGSANSYSLNAFHALLTQPDDTEFETQEMLILQDWENSDHYCIIATQVPDEQHGFLRGYGERLNSTLGSSISTALDDCIVTLTRTKDVALVAQSLQSIARYMDTSFGISFLFSFLDEPSLALYYQQAREAASFGQEHNKQITFFKECALSSLLLSESRDFRVASLHPLLEVLRRYDTEHDTELSQTLHTYLLCERSILKTAQTLYVHRNTVQYRIRRVEEIYPLDLEDSYEREYLLASYRLYLVLH